MTIRFTSATLLATLVACSGGPIGSSTPAANTLPAVQDAAKSHRMGHAVLRIVIPPPSRKQRKRKHRMHTAYISAGTKSAVIKLYAPTLVATLTANLTPTSPHCSGVPTVCMITLPPLPLMTEINANMVMYDGLNGAGDALSADVEDGITTVPLGEIEGDFTNIFKITLNGVVSKFKFAWPTPMVEGTASTGKFNIIGYDAAGDIIVGPGDYVMMPSGGFLFDDGTGQITFCGAGGGGPGCTSTLTYDGAPMSLPALSNGNVVGSWTSWRISGSVDGSIPSDYIQQFFNLFPIVSYESLPMPTGPIHFDSPSSSDGKPFGNTLSNWACWTGTSGGLCSSSNICSAVACYFAANVSTGAGPYTIYPFANGVSVLTLARQSAAQVWNGSTYIGTPVDQVQIPVTVGPSPYPAYTAFAASNVSITKSASTGVFTITDLSSPPFTGTFSLRTVYCSTKSLKFAVPWIETPKPIGHVVIGSNPLFTAPATAQMTGGSATFSIVPKAEGVCQVEITEPTSQFDGFYYVTITS